MHYQKKHIKYEKFEMQLYLKPNSISLNSARFHFKARSSMLNIRGNFKSQFNSEQLYCQGCLKTDAIETQNHIYDCSSLSSSEIISHNDDHNYSDLFKDNFMKQLRFSSFLKTRLETRDKIIKARENNALHSK